MKSQNLEGLSLQSKARFQILLLTYANDKTDGILFNYSNIL